MNLSKLVNPSRIKRGLYWQRALNLVAGYSPLSEACLNCWSAAFAHRQGKRKNMTDYQKRLWQGLTTEDGKWNRKIRCLEENLDLPLRTRKPTLWSVWNDLGHPNVGSDFIFNALANMLRASHHFFLILTKRPHRFEPYFNLNHPLAGDLWQIAKRNHGPEWPLPNIGLGTTVELSKYTSRIIELLSIPTALHFVSLEPLLGELSIKEHLPQYCCNGEDCACRGMPLYPALDWVQLGCESGPKRRHSEPRWFEIVIRDCKQAGVPVFFKQMERDGKVVHAPELASGEPLLQFPEVEL